MAIFKDFKSHQIDDGTSLFIVAPKDPNQCVQITGKGVPTKYQGALDDSQLNV